MGDMEAFLTLGFPLMSALLLLSLRPQSEKTIARVSVSFSLLTALSSSLVLISYLRKGYHEHPLPWFESLTLRVDPLSSVMAVAVSVISFLVHAYSVRYMQDDSGYRRFFVLLDLITFSILLTVLSGNLILLVLGWHLIGVFLFFLLFHNLSSDQAGRYAVWTFLVHRIGDLFLIVAVGLLAYTYKTFHLQTILEEVSKGNSPLVETVGILLVLSAFAKSAQVPFHIWLPYTMAGPTPVSALMHAGIVNAGGFLINRFAPLYSQAEYGLHLAFWVGLLTAILGSALMLMQTDIKKALGYSTVGQMGYMIMECGVGAFALAIYHLIAHGIFKATLFMGSGNVIHHARKDPNIPEDEVYSFLVKKEMPPSRVPWIVFALITVSVPLAIVVFAHLIAGVEVFKYQGALILLFFGWVTGAQTIFSIYKMASRNVLKLLLFVLVSFSVVVMGYVVIGHSFEAFLYPDKALVEKIYQKAGIDPLIFEAMVILITLLVVVGWFFVYYASSNRDFVARKFKSLYLSLYTHLSRELYVTDFYSFIAKKTVSLSKEINRLTRWL